MGGESSDYCSKYCVNSVYIYGDFYCPDLRDVFLIQ